MMYRVFWLMVVLVGLMGSSTFAQDKPDSPASPSDIPVDQIQKESAQPEPPVPSTEPQATEQPAAPSEPAASPAAAADDAPQPVAEGTPVAQPDCGTPGCATVTVDPCAPRCRAGLFQRIRGLFSRRCCR